MVRSINRACALDDPERALEWLQRSYEEHASVLLELGSPAFDQIRDAPEFRELAQRLRISN